LDLLVSLFTCKILEMKKLLLTGTICLSIAALITLFSGCGESQTRAPKAPKIDISEESWDFGTVKTGSDVKHTITIRNIGGDILTLYAYPSCPACMYLELEKYSIPPKSETKLHIIKIVETQAGPYESSIIVDSNDPTQQKKTLTVKGTFIN
jgi:hypothetical protein